MRQYDISQIVHPKANYRVVNMFQQLWDCDGYDYRSTPRPECGLLLVTQGSITYHFAELQLQAVAGDLLFLPKGCNYQVTTGYARDYLVNFQTDAAPCRPIQSVCLPALPGNMWIIFSGWWR